MVFRRLIDAVFGVDEWSEYPAAGSGRRGDWVEQEHNARLKRTIGAKKSAAIQQADETSKQKFERMDKHIRQLNEIRIGIRERMVEAAKEFRPANAKSS